jgi:mono/diheme cytochrome c family protein
MSGAARRGRGWRLVGRGVAGLFGIVAIAATGIGAVAHGRWDRTFDVAEPALSATTDPLVIDRGRALVFGAAYCSYCHMPIEQWPRLDAGEELPLVGGYALELPIGTLRSANLTPDVETGIGRYSDGQLARMLRHNVRPDGRAVLPLMEYQDLSDEDVVAVISYLRSVPPVHNAVPASEYNLIGKAVMATLIRPIGPTAPVRAASPPAGVSIERGEYLATAVANCVACHSPRSTTDGSYTGPRFSGGSMDVDGDPTQQFSVPNLTPDPATGHIVDWTEARFLARFRAGKLYPASHMPWGAFGRMSEEDLLSIYRYLMSLDPVVNETGPLLQPKKR